VSSLLCTPGDISILRRHGKRIGIALWEDRAQVRERGSGKVLLDAKLDEDGVAEGIAFSADGNFLMVFGDKFPQVWDLRTGSRVQTLLGHSDEVFSGAFGQHGRVFATGSGYMHARGEPPEEGNAVRIWDARANRELLSYRSAGLSVTALAFGKDDTRIVAASMDGIVRRYECEACLSLPALLSLSSSRAGRELSPEESARYVPQGGLWPWH
jgi:WD40 repeat protein